MTGRVTPSQAHTTPVMDLRCDTLFDDELSREWDILLAQSSADSVFLTSAWLRAWHETFGRYSPLIVPQVRTDGHLIAAAAFLLSNGVIEFAGAGPSDYSDFVTSRHIDDNLRIRAIDALLVEAKAAAQSFRYFRLGRVQPESETLKSIAEPRSKFMWTFVGGATAAPYLDMALVEDRLRKKSLRRHERGLERSGSLACDTHVTADAILPQLDDFFELHVARWQSSGVESLFLQDHTREFYRRLTSGLDATGQLRFTTLRLGGRLIAAHFGFLHSKRFTWYKPTFDPTIAKLSPGEVLIKRLLELARDEGAAVFDFTIGNEPFKLRFASGVRDVWYLHVTDSLLAAMARRGRAFIGRHVRALANCKRSSE